MTDHARTLDIAPKRLRAMSDAALARVAADLGAPRPVAPGLPDLVEHYLDRVVDDARKVLALRVVARVPERGGALVKRLARSSVERHACAFAGVRRQRRAAQRAAKVAGKRLEPWSLAVRDAAV